MAEEYVTPEHEWVSAATARRRLERLADRLDALEQRLRAAFIRANWSRVAARPMVWQELEGLATRWESEVGHA